jgi:hypothetical protein
MNRRTSTETTPRGYIVRVYRRTADGLVGQVQDALTGRVRAFRTIAELWTALGGRPRPARRPDAGAPNQTHDKEPS